MPKVIFFCTTVTKLICFVLWLIYFRTMESLMCRLCLKNFENIVKTPIVSKKRQPKKIKSNRPENTCGPDQSESDVAIEGSEDEWLMISTEMIVTTTKNMNQKLMTNSTMIVGLIVRNARRPILLNQSWKITFESTKKGTIRCSHCSKIKCLLHFLT